MKKNCITCKKELSENNPNKKCFACIENKTITDIIIKENPNKKVLAAVKKQELKNRKKIDKENIEENKITKKFLKKVSLELKK